MLLNDLNIIYYTITLDSYFCTDIGITPDELVTNICFKMIKDR